MKNNLNIWVGKRTRRGFFDFWISYHRDSVAKETTFEYHVGFFWALVLAFIIGYYLAV